MNWYEGSLPEALENSKEKIIMVDFYADWWSPCKMLDAHTFSNDNVINYISENFIPLKINAETKEGSALFQECNGTGYPLIIFFDKLGIGGII